jgi:hypothetical protein
MMPENRIAQRIDSSGAVCGAERFARHRLHEIGLSADSRNLTTKDTKLHEGYHAGLPFFVFLRDLGG